MNDRAYAGIVRYHERTKHHFRRFARSLGYMDWKNQPNPFRVYQVKEATRLPFLQKDPPADYLHMYRREGNEPREFNLENIAGFLELALGLSAWKAISGSQWSLRINPSSGNLHPTECHLILPSNSSLTAGVFHYNPFEHCLERRAEVHSELWEMIHGHFGTQGFLVALSSIFWRESWKYGERAFRYCNHDVGHALACLSFSANLQGWGIKYLNSLSDEQSERILGFDRIEWVELEAEYPELICFVSGNQILDVPRYLQREIIDGLSGVAVTGIPNRLSRQRVRWDCIDEVAALTKKPETPERKYTYGERSFLPAEAPSISAASIIRRRRSAVAFEGERSLTRDQFMAVLDRTMPRDRCAPFDLELSDPCVNLLIFVHNVSGVLPGLYFLLRNQQDFEELKSLARRDLMWRPIEKDLPVYLLEEGNFRQTAVRVSCDQDIAGYGVFSLGMIARFREVIQKEPFRYRHLFWETGMIGQILYLEAEAHGLRGTGIGCFYDDPVHDIMGFTENQYQSLYHFTVGDPVEDSRLTTYPAYAHLAARRDGQ